jgi:phosphatidylserine/phosphatidylglycerophosphate/cardiolipin synthase-like enzyme
MTTQSIRQYVLLLLLLFCLQIVYGQAFISIADARQQAEGATIAVRGIVTNGPELGRIRYMQDGTAGIAAFPGTGSVSGFDERVRAGDSIEVTGRLLNFRGLLEISPITAFRVIVSGRPLPTPKPVMLAQIGESLESQLVKAECLLLQNAGTPFAGGTTVDLADNAGGKARLFLRNGHPLDGTKSPTGTVSMTFVVSQFDEYQLLPRSAADLVPSTCFYLTDIPDQSNIQTTGFALSWKTNLPATATLRYGSTPALGREIALTAAKTEQSAVLTGLQPGTIYWAQVTAANGGTTVQSPLQSFATRSESSGQIRVYFNHPIDLSAAGGLRPNGDSDKACIDAIINRIDSAKQTIDASLYNNSRTDLTNALKAAHARGVRVRYIAALDTRSIALQPPPAFPVIYGNAGALMHNKFLAIDAESVNDSWVMCGSLNWTNSNIIDDYNNNLFIQDQSLARTYVLEFEEMWGGSGRFADTAKMRFGSLKSDNTPHRFIIGGRTVEQYFSPTDNVTQRIIEQIDRADATVSFALLSFTKNTIGIALENAFNRGVRVRGMIENVNDPGSEYGHLLSVGIPVRVHSFANVLHHKYAVIDANRPDADPTVITGSHNWSFNGEDRNDENTVVIHDSNIARLFQAEYQRREAENSVSVKTLPTTDFDLLPNPATDNLRLTTRSPLPAGSRLEIWSVTGQLLRSDRVQAPGQTFVLPVAALPAGAYFLKISTPDGLLTLPFQTIRP